MTASKEDYLKAMLELSKNNTGIHSADIADALGVSRASVSRMMNELKNNGYVEKEKYTTVILTKKGIEAAICIQKKHELLKSFLIKVLGVDTDVAIKDACKMEHIISDKTVDKINQKINSINI